jgi:hypothetical protein
MLMFAILFGLSVDYNVFLLSAVQDERVAGHSARAAVARTSALIATAGIMTMVFLGFSITDETEVRMIGIGLATAVLIDISIVRPLLAPALLGEHAWWAPAWLTPRAQPAAVQTHCPLPTELRCGHGPSRQPSVQVGNIRRDVPEHDSRLVATLLRRSRQPASQRRLPGYPRHCAGCWALYASVPAPTVGQRQPHSGQSSVGRWRAPKWHSGGNCFTSLGT